MEEATKIIISKSECLNTVKEIIDSDYARAKKEKLGNFENICEILRNFGVSILKEPVDKVSQ